MSAYLLGNLIGRFALSYAVIWLVMWLMLARLNWRDAFRRTNHWSGLVAATTLFLIGMTLTATAAERVGRPMLIHRVAELGLEIWTEQDPQWETHLHRANGATTFSAETSALTYPPAHMSWTTVPELRFAEHDIETAARGALHQVAANFRVRLPDRISMKPRQYGDLIGFESVFEAESERVPIDVRAFCGHRPGKPAVVMQVSTLRNKLPHLHEHVRRSWSHVRYLQ